MLALGLGWSAAPARADGDPASDVLATQLLYLPQDAGVPAAQQAQLGALLQTAARDGYQIRVALIASRADLGSVTELWGQPQNYAQFLGQELSLAYKGPLLVVMPGGFGLYQLGGGPVAGRAALAGLSAPGGAQGTAALTVVQRLAAAAGHPLPLPSAQPLSKQSSTDVLPWIVFAIGAALILLAWTASIRARPLGLRGRLTSS
jgi:hypothetical protein